MEAAIHDGRGRRDVEHRAERLAEPGPDGGRIGKTFMIPDLDRDRTAVGEPPQERAGSDELALEGRDERLVSGVRAGFAMAGKHRPLRRHHLRHRPLHVDEQVARRIPAPG